MGHLTPVPTLSRRPWLRKMCLPKSKWYVMCNTPKVTQKLSVRVNVDNSQFFFRSNQHNTFLVVRLGDFLGVAILRLFYTFSLFWRRWQISRSSGHKPKYLLQSLYAILQCYYLFLVRNIFQGLMKDRRSRREAFWKNRPICILSASAICQHQHWNFFGFLYTMRQNNL